MPEIYKINEKDIKNKGGILKNNYFYRKIFKKNGRIKI